MRVCSINTVHLYTHFVFQSRRNSVQEHLLLSCQWSDTQPRTNAILKGTGVEIDSLGCHYRPANRKPWWLQWLPVTKDCLMGEQLENRRGWLGTLKDSVFMGIVMPFCSDGFSPWGLMFLKRVYHFSFKEAQRWFKGPMDGLYGLYFFILDSGGVTSHH